MVDRCDRRSRGVGGGVRAAGGRWRNRERGVVPRIQGVGRQQLIKRSVDEEISLCLSTTPIHVAISATQSLLLGL